MNIVRYLSAEKLAADDFGVPFTGEVGEVVYDAKTHVGSWATMSDTSFLAHGVRVGTGWGQKYVRQQNGELHKVEG